MFNMSTWSQNDWSLFFAVVAAVIVIGGAVVVAITDKTKGK